MKMNSLGLALLKSLEGCKLTAYKLSGEKYYTIGYGHSDSTIKKGQTITQAQADAYLVSDLEKFEKYVTNYAVKKFSDLNGNQFSALVSYTYNRGLGGLKELLKNSSTISEMGWNMTTYWGSNSNYKDALIARRKKEQLLYFTDYVETTQLPTVTLDLVVPTPTLKRGSKGTQVRYLQKFLNLNNPNNKLDEDGHFGEATYKAVYNFQCANAGCGTPDGVYGPHTRDVVKEIINKVNSI